MSRLPTVGGDNGNWGAILNDYLSQEHNPDGSLKIRTDGTLSSGIADGSITASKLSPTVNNYLASAQTAVQTVNGKSGTSVTLAASDVSAVSTSAVGAAGGIATLDGSSKLTASQLPSTVATSSQLSDYLRKDAPAINPVLGSTAIQSLLTDSTVAGPSIGTRTTGLTTSTMAAAATTLINTMSGGSYTSGNLTRIQPNYADPKADTTYRLSGPFNYWGGSTATAQQVGQFQTARTDSTPDGGGMTGSYGEISFRFRGRYLVQVMRDTSGTQYIEYFAGKDGAAMKPFRALSNQNGQEIFTSPGDGLYYLVPIDLGSSGDWQIKMYTESATFGGFYFISTDQLTYPNWRAGKLLLLGDSFSVPGQGQYRHSLGFVPLLGRALGMDVHLSGQGGTGYRAKGFVSFGPVVESNLLNYEQRIPYDVDRYFDDVYKPDAIVVLGSQNDRSGEFDGTTTLDNSIAAVLGGLYDRFPGVPMFATGLMHTRTETWNAEYETINAQIKSYIDANPDMNIQYVRSLLQDNNTYGTGYQGNTNGSGPSDTLTWTDSSHPSAAISRSLPGSDYLGNGGQGAIARKIRDEILRLTPYRARQSQGYVSTASTTRTTNASDLTAGTLSVARLATDLVARRRLVRRWTTRLDATNTQANNVDRTPGETFAPYAVAFGAAGSARAVEVVDPADYAVSGKTTQFILAVTVKNGGVAITTGGLGVVLVSVNAVSGGAAGTDPSATYSGTITGSTGGLWNSGSPIIAAGAISDQESSAPFTISSKTSVAPRIQNYTALPTDASLILDIALFAVNS